MSARRARTWLSLAALLLTAALGGSCGPREEVLLTVRLPLDVDVDPAAIVVEPAGTARLWRSSRLTLLADRAAPRVIVRAPGLCPLELAVGAGAREGIARPWIDLGGDRAQVGFDAPFEIDVAAGCAEAGRGEVTWRQVEGAPLVDLRLEERGFRLHARTRPRGELRPDPLPWGIVPVSARAQGRFVLEATWKGEGGPVRRTVTVTSIARATGVPSIAVGQRVLLGGSGWRVRAAPPRGLAQVLPGADGAAFEPDAPGPWRLEDGSGRELRLRAGFHDRTPLDCGRSECHASETDMSASSPMTGALQRFQGAAEPAGGVGCMLDCHVVGERGLHDGGFLDAARKLPYRTGRASWEELPRVLRRLGGVTCTGCHGPAAIPEPSARRSVLAADVCATCHDSPPRYVHVEQWRASRMARSDAQPSVRANVACARCHTTAGFLAAIGARKPEAASENDAPFGVACAACHAPHGAHLGEALVRAVPMPDALGGAAAGARHPTSGVCVACHAPGRDDPMPTASAAVLWLGRAVLPSGDVVTGPAPHEPVEGGCIGCHGGLRPTKHGFEVDRGGCAACHATEAREVPDVQGRTVQARALQLWGQLTAQPAPGAPPHARAAAVPPKLARALYEVALVLEDPAAWAHNAAFARALLDDAEAAGRAM